MSNTFRIKQKQVAVYFNDGEHSMSCWHEIKDCSPKLKQLVQLSRDIFLDLWNPGTMQIPEGLRRDIAAISRVSELLHVPEVLDNGWVIDFREQLEEFLGNYKTAQEVHDLSIQDDE